MGKAGEQCIHSGIPEVYPAKWLSVIRGDNRNGTYLSTGATVELVKQMLANNPKLKHWLLNSMPLWSMKAKDTQANQVGDFDSIITVEDHLMDAGFGSWLLEAISIRPDLLTRIKIKSLDSTVCGMVGKQSTSIANDNQRFLYNLYQ